MAKQYDGFQPDQTAFVAAQRVFFVATAAPEGRVNLSPKGMDSLRILTPNRVIWLNVTGSGNETAAHLALSPRMTLMWMSVSERPMILRAYGQARVLHQDASDWAVLAQHLPALPGTRQIFDLSVDLVQSSCGFAVPFMETIDDRPVLRNWAESKGEEGLRAYWGDRNRSSIDGYPTGIEGNL